MRISDWSSDVCSSDLHALHVEPPCLRETAAQRGALAHPLRMAEHGHVEVFDAAGGAVVGAVVDDDDRLAVRTRVDHDLADSSRFVARGNDHGGVAAAPSHARATAERPVSHARSPPATKLENTQR